MILNRLAEDLADLAIVEQRPQQDGRNMTMMLGPARTQQDGGSRHSLLAAPRRFKQHLELPQECGGSLSFADAPFCPRAAKGVGNGRTPPLIAYSLRFHEDAV